MFVISARLIGGDVSFWIVSVSRDFGVVYNRGGCRILEWGRQCGAIISNGDTDAY